MATNKIKKYITMNIVDISQGLQSIHTVGTPILVDISAGWVHVGIGNIVRVVVAANTYIAFDDADLGAGVAVSATSNPSVMVVTGEHYVIASGDWIRASANPTRVEILAV